MRKATLLQRICAAVVFLAVFFAYYSSAYAAGSSPKFNPKGVTGWAGVGFANFTVKNPESGYKLDRGQAITPGGEKGFNVLNLYLTFGFNYLTTTGQSQYAYQTLSGESYSATDVNFRAELFQASLGLKFKIFDGGWFKPYVEGGGMFGYYAQKYDFNSAQRTALDATGTNYKKEDAIIDMGNYVEGGLEILFSDSFGLKAGARLIRGDTKEVETLGKAKVRYEAEVFYLGLLKSF